MWCASGGQCPASRLCYRGGRRSFLRFRNCALTGGGACLLFLAIAALTFTTLSTYDVSRGQGLELESELLGGPTTGVDSSDAYSGQAEGLRRKADQIPITDLRRLLDPSRLSPRCPCLPLSRDQALGDLDPPERLCCRRDPVWFYGYRWP